MAVYRDTDQVKELFGELWTTLADDPEVGPKLKESGVTVLFRIKDPDISMYIDPDGVKWDAEAGQANPVITLMMSGDVVHRFWLRKLNVAKALATGQVKTRGPVPKVMKLLPLIKPGYGLYVDLCGKYGIPTDV